MNSFEEEYAELSSRSIQVSDMLNEALIERGKIRLEIEKAQLKADEASSALQEQEADVLSACLDTIYEDSQQDKKILTAQ